MGVGVIGNSDDGGEDKCGVFFFPACGLWVGSNKLGEQWRGGELVSMFGYENHIVVLSYFGDALVIASFSCMKQTLFSEENGVISPGLCHDDT